MTRPEGMGFLLKICWSIEKCSRRKKCRYGSMLTIPAFSYGCYMAKAIHEQAAERIANAAWRKQLRYKFTCMSSLFTSARYGESHTWASSGADYECCMAKAIQRDEAERNRAAFLNEVYHSSLLTRSLFWSTDMRRKQWSGLRMLHGESSYDTSLLVWVAFLRVYDMAKAAADSA